MRGLSWIVVIGEAVLAADEIAWLIFNAVREFVNKWAASAASPDYVKFQAVIKSAASAASQIQGTQVQGSARSVARAPFRRPAAPRVGAALISMLQVTYKLNGSGAKCTGGAPNARGGRRMHFWGAECTRGAPNAPRGRRTHRQGAERTGS